MKKNLRALSLIVVTAFSIAACNKSADAPVNTPQPEDNAKKVLEYIQALGAPASIIEDKGDKYVVDGDIVFPKNMKVPEHNGKITTEQYYSGSLINAASSRDIRLYVDPTMTSMISEINSAIAQWNTTVPGSRIRWRIVSGAPYDVRIVDSNLGTGVCGQGTFPSGGLAGNMIWINKAYIAGNSFAQRARTICHEMGHNISLWHTNQSGGVAVPGVGGSDAASLMNGGQCGSGATVLSAKDKQATAVLYPAP
ncbi:hypothetical protein KTO58_15645 [Chitinophaga pendula]|uniref:M57 family metalloprotease n=1 Tax=Chitinophaga TaxID=79328 RepID=UPI000BB09905|nr:MULTISPECIES: M57 family metalloprotease [Chitinophaga]ASZ11843.1 hypothetical protein CK934_13195 [Chitinophaga sp. MD30]UCJ05130.1 hypothetical protein KTO58_15645 [Chitinophaga pendula]